MKKFFFHGASVTQQSKEDSYIYQLRELMVDFAEISISSKGYGGCHFSPTAILTVIRDVSAEAMVDVCVLEWNTTGLGYFSGDDLAYVVGSLVEMNVRPVFLILGRLETLRSNRQAEDSVLDFCLRNDIFVWDLRSCVGASDFRDVVHTNNSGAMKYAVELSKLVTSFDFCSDKKSQTSIDFKRREISVTEPLLIDVAENSTLVINVSGILGSNSSIGIETVHGPASGCINIHEYSKINMWDKWSHYDRLGFISIGPLKHEASCLVLRIEVLPDPIDYTDCARAGFCFLHEKVFKVRRLFSTNCKIEEYYVEPSLSIGP
jgi:hypothetical protein